MTLLYGLIGIVYMSHPVDDNVRPTAYQMSELMDSQSFDPRAFNHVPKSTTERLAALLLASEKIDERAVKDIFLNRYSFDNPRDRGREAEIRNLIRDRYDNRQESDKDRVIHSYLGFDPEIDELRGHVFRLLNVPPAEPLPSRKKSRARSRRRSRRRSF